VKKEKAPERVLRNRCITVFRDSSHFIFKVRILFLERKTTFFTMATQLQNGKRECSKERGLNAFHALQRQNTEISKQVYPEKEYRGLSPNFHIPASVSKLYIPMISLPFLLEEICRPILGLYKSLTDT
jgi:hypothetical protein